MDSEISKRLHTPSYFTPLVKKFDEAQRRIRAGERWKGKRMARDGGGSGKTGEQFSWQFGLAVRQQRPVDSTNLSCLARLRSSPFHRPRLVSSAPPFCFRYLSLGGGLQETSRAMNINASMEKYYPPLSRWWMVFVPGNYRDYFPLSICYSCLYTGLLSLNRSINLLPMILYIRVGQFYKFYLLFY